MPDPINALQNLASQGSRNNNPMMGMGGPQTGQIGGPQQVAPINASNLLQTLNRGTGQTMNHLQMRSTMGMVPNNGPMGNQIGNQLQAQMSGQLPGQQGNQIGGQMNSGNMNTGNMNQMSGQMQNQLQPQLPNQLQGQISGQLGKFFKTFCNRFV